MTFEKMRKIVGYNAAFKRERVFALDKKSVASFFDNIAAKWEQSLHCDDDKIDKILDCADIGEGKSVLDIACGTGVLFPYYIKRDAAKIIGVDISRKMVEKALEKAKDERITVLMGDAESLKLNNFDRCVIFNAFPHFEKPRNIILAAKTALAKGGRFTVAHDESRAKINSRHLAIASEVSIMLPCAEELACMMEKWFTVDVKVDSKELYIVSGVLK
ncbi:MAG: class I SAM-dependent methyltransferase [Oscillospiraceae bacterium]